MPRCRSTRRRRARVLLPCGCAAAAAAANHPPSFPPSPGACTSRAVCPPECPDTRYIPAAALRAATRVGARLGWGGGVCALRSSKLQCLAARLCVFGATTHTRTHHTLRSVLSDPLTAPLPTAPFYTTRVAFFQKKLRSFSLHFSFLLLFALLNIITFIYAPPFLPSPPLPTLPILGFSFRFLPLHDTCVGIWNPIFPAVRAACCVRRHHRGDVYHWNP